MCEAISGAEARELIVKRMAELEAYRSTVARKEAGELDVPIVVPSGLETEVRGIQGAVG